MNWCKDCRYFVAASTGTGKCHYYPPRVVVTRLAEIDSDDDANWESPWPFVRAGDACCSCFLKQEDEQ